MGYGVIFDLDGTLVDSAGDLQAALNRLLPEYDLSLLDLASVKLMIGDGVAKLVERAFVATGGDLVSLNVATVRFLELYEGNTTERTIAYPGVHDTLSELFAAGLTLCVVTNKPHAATMEILEALKLNRFFATVVGGDSTPRRKPHPDPILKVLADARLRPTETIMVGDNYHDVEAAHSVGLPAIMVTYGYSHKPPASVGADYLVDEIPAIIPILRQRGILCQ
jgi:phosphoglycolate phosphatase